MKRDPLCGDTEQLVSYLYGECEANERTAVERHLAACRDCSNEVANLQGVRLDLQSWTPPEVVLDIHVPRTESPSILTVAGASGASQADARLPFWSRPPAWAQLAAAVLILAAGAAIAHVEVRYGAEGFTIRTGWSSAPSGAASRTAATPAANTNASASWRTEMAALETQLRSEFRAATLQSRVGTSPVATTRDAAADQANMLRRVRALIETSEENQRRELALQIASVVRDMKAQQINDLSRTAYVLGVMENRTGAVVAEQQKTINYLVRASQTK